MGNVGEGEASGSKPSSRSATPTSILEGKGELQKILSAGVGGWVWQVAPFPGPSLKGLGMRLSTH